MDTETLFVLGTLVNRSLMIGAGALSIWLGSRLFSRAHPAAGAEITVLEYVKINLFQVGPGTFYCLGGTAILLYHLHLPATFTVAHAPSAPTPSHGAAAPTSTIMVSGAQGAAPDALQQERQRTRALQHIQLIDQLSLLAEGKGHTQGPAPQHVAVGVRELKLDLLRHTWRDQWGDSAEFAELVRADAPELRARYPGAAEAFGRGTP